VGPPPRAPGRPARPRGRRHSRARDTAVISHHYDLSNAFYALLLDPSMAYSCALWTKPPGTPGHTLGDAQHDKLEAICRKLELTPGARLLDIGCGWGSLTLHAAAHHGARVTAVTLAGQQAAHVRRAALDRGLGERVEVRHQHYRELAGPGEYDVVASVEMGEHVGDASYPHFAALFHDRLRPGGRLLLQQMARGRHAPGGGPFIETYIAPDMTMRPLGDTLNLLESAGLETLTVESLRADYAHTVDAWRATLEAEWDRFVALVGRETARVWRLYLAGGGLAFEERRKGVHQILAERPTPPAASGGGAR
ncbi:cyclopropane-fatty-acyl-phospholipid synthase family protein, partial [Streptomyces sedi]